MKGIAYCRTTIIQPCNWWQISLIALAIGSIDTSITAAQQIPNQTLGQLSLHYTAPQPLIVSQASSLLQVGDIGEAVSQLQRRLADLDFYRGRIDGDFGSETEAAVRQFQRSRSLTPDGIVGPQTAAALSNANSPGNSSDTSVPRGERYSVVELQRRLQQRNFYRGPLDGVLGPLTRAAIAEAQRAYGLQERDILDGQFP